MSGKDQTSGDFVSQPTESDYAADFPTAEVATASKTEALFLQSKMWWITLLCLLLAVWLTWRSLPETGPIVTIHFPEGHGLQVGNSLRFRGIDVGTVTSVSLNETLASVDVQVMLKSEGGRLNREGARFWIVRPQVSLTKISGLDTAVGARYINVSPGDPGGLEATTFNGLPAPPPDELSAAGLQLVLRSDERHGLDAGAPVTWRGVEVGQVLSVGLSPDARHVLTSIRINRGYRRLVQSKARFWVTSGFGVDLSLTGLKLNAQSLATIVRGGISFISLGGDSSDVVQDGRVFPLYGQADEDWIEQAAKVPLVDFSLPRTVTLQYQATTSIFGIRRTREVMQSGLLIAGSNGTELLTAELPVSPVDPDHLVPVTLLNSDGGQTDFAAVLLQDCRKPGSGLMKFVVDGGDDAPRIDSSSLRIPESPEECLVVRTAGDNDQPVPLIQAFDQEQLVVDNDIWKLLDSSGDLSVWHGAPVVSARDGKIIGLLLNLDSGPVIAPYTDNRKSTDE